MISTEHVIGTAPFTVRRRVKWGDCDAAGVVYTVVFSEYVVSAAELFYGFLFDTTPQKAKNENGFGTPTRSLSFDFRQSLRPDEEFDMTVTIADIRTRSYVLDILARTLTGEEIFHAVLTPICIAREERKSIEMPASFRHALETHRAGLPAPTV